MAEHVRYTGAYGFQPVRIDADGKKWTLVVTARNLEGNEVQVEIETNREKLMELRTRLARLNHRQI